MSSNKSEKPTPKRLRDSRQEGQVAQSQDISSAATLIGFVLLFSLMGTLILGRLIAMFQHGLELSTLGFEEGFSKALDNFIYSTLIITIPSALFLAICGTLAGFFQVGFLFSIKPVTPDLKKVNPAEGFKKLFSIDNVVELIKSVIKVSVVSIVVWLIIRDALEPIIKIPFGGFRAAQGILVALLNEMLWSVSLCFIAVASLDYVFQKYRFVEKLKMSKQDVKQEHKDNEGDPQLRGARRRAAQEIASGN